MINGWMYFHFTWPKHVHRELVGVQKINHC